MKLRTIFDSTSQIFYRKRYTSKDAEELHSKVMMNWDTDTGLRSNVQQIYNEENTFPEIFFLIPPLNPLYRNEIPIKQHMSFSL